MKLQMAKNAFSSSVATTNAQRLGQSKQMMNVKMAAMKVNKSPNHDTLNINGREMSTANLNAILKANNVAAMAKATGTIV
jgi:hypothetical protein